MNVNQALFSVPDSETNHTFFETELMHSIIHSGGLNYMSITLGVSVYPEQETLEQIDAYLKLASSHGFTKVFTSMFSVP